MIQSPLNHKTIENLLLMARSQSISMKLPYQKSLFFPFCYWNCFHCEILTCDTAVGLLFCFIHFTMLNSSTASVRAMNFKWNYSVLSLWKLCAHETRRQFPQNAKLGNALRAEAWVSEAHNGILDLLHQCTWLQGRACSRKKSNFNDLETVIKPEVTKIRTHGPNKRQKCPKFKTVVNFKRIQFSRYYDFEM